MSGVGGGAGYKEGQGGYVSDRMLKIEAVGDFWRGLTKPKILLVGRWLERAGFKAGDRVRVTCVAPGVIELRSRDAGLLDGVKEASEEDPF